MGYGSVPLSGITTAAETLLLPPYNSVIVDSFSSKAIAAAATPAPMQSDSGLTYNHLPLTRKRSRDSLNPFFFSYPSSQPHKINNGSFSFLGEDISLEIQQQQLEIDLLITQHMEKVRMEVEEKRKTQAIRIIEAIEMGMIKRLRSKDEEIEKIGKLNWALEERIRSLFFENQILRDMAQTNEATANALRTDLEQVLAAQVKEERTRGGLGLLDQDGGGAATAPLDDAQSCCGSNDGLEGEAEVDGGGRNCNYYENNGMNGGTEGTRTENNNGSSVRWCRNCWKEESCVLLLPCRHLCLCTVCGSSLLTCPICKSTNNASVHVIMS